MAKLDSCIHIFCYSCIKDWADVTNECPLCKRRFNNIEKCQSNGDKIESVEVKFKKQIYEYDIAGVVDVDHGI